MIWLASYPRSGNTFMRIVLHEVYGIKSSTYHRETRYPLDENYDKYPVVKTHLLPHQLVPDEPDIPAVYLVRDGRDALVSMAHHRSDLIEPGTDFLQNLRESIIAPGDSYFGGWSTNVRHWLRRARIIIKFEELISDPIACCERLREIMDLPEPVREKLPTFQDLKTKDYPYGSGVEHGFDEKKRQELRKKFFRKGKRGGWKEEMPPDLQELFWDLHGEVMEMLGYKREG
jgi:hypothetical protein